MGTHEIENPYPPPTTTTTTITSTTTTTTDDQGEKKEDDDNVSPIEQVRLTVAKTGDPTLPVWTFRMWFLGVLYCCLLSFLHKFFSYRIKPHIPPTVPTHTEQKQTTPLFSPMGTQEIEHQYPPTTTATATFDVDKKEDDDDVSPIEQVRLIVPNTDDPTLPVWTFRMWFLGVISCCLLSFLNQFFSYRSEQLVLTQIMVLPIGRFMHAVLPRTQFRIPGCGDRLFSLNPGPFNMKEHVLITIFANAGSAFGNGAAYGVGIINIIKTLYHRKISFVAAWILVITTQVLGYGWAGLFRKYVVEPAQMWWPGNLVEVTLFRASHEEDKQRMSREKFFSIALICSFSWYLLPGYLFPTLTSISWVCWAFPKSVTAQQIGSGFDGLGVGALTLDWSVVSSFLPSPLISPFFSIVNVFVGYVLTVYIVVPISYWGLDLYGARKFPIFSSNLFTGQGQQYNISAIVNDKFGIDMVEYEKQGPIHLSMFFALAYGFGFASLAATLSHVSLFHGREIYERHHASYKCKDDIHTRLMRKYEDIPSWWFHILLLVTIGASLLLCTILKSQVQIPWWGLLFACLIAFIFTLPISIITATTNQTPGLNIITEYIMGLIYPGRPIANVCFKVYGYMSMVQAVSFLNDFKLGHYMKIPPRSMFLVQLIGTIVAGTINVGAAWWLLNSIEDICQPDLLPSSSPWTCPSDRIFFDASVIWGLVGPKQIFGKFGNYGAVNFFFLFGAAGPIVVWLFHKAFPKQSWIPLVNLPVLLGVGSSVLPATAVNYTSWIIVGTIFNFCIFRYRKKWWQRYNYVLSGALDTRVALMAVLLYLSVGTENEQVNWWGTKGEHCELAICPTAKGIIVDGCPLH